MPELPEVESFKKYIDDTSLNQKIATVKLSTVQMLLNTTEEEIINTLSGNAFKETYRHGKFLFIKLQHDGYLALHFGMTGDLLYLTPDHKHPKAFILMLNFVNGKTLLFSDSRMLGKIALVKDIDTFITQRGYGEDALQITEENFIKLLSKRRVAIKAILMDQKIVAGVGNEFSDAILFQCKIHPLSKSNKLTLFQFKDLYKIMRKILTEAVAVNADRSRLDHYFLLNHRKEGLKCVRCTGVTELKTIGGRSSYFCPSCQILYV